MSDPNTEDHPRTNVFLSYCREDRFRAGTIKLDLESRGADVFFDMDKLRAGTWREQVSNEIGQADFFVVLLTPNAVTSDAVKAEIEIAHASLQPKQIIPVLLETCDMPLSLKPLRYVDFVEAEYDYAIVDLAWFLGLSTDETFKRDPPMPESWLRPLRRLERMFVVAFLVLVVWLSYSLGWPGLVIGAGVAWLIYVKLAWVGHIYHYGHKLDRETEQTRLVFSVKHHRHAFRYNDSSTGDPKGIAYPIRGAATSILLLLLLAPLSAAIEWLPLGWVAGLAMGAVLVFVVFEYEMYPRAVGIEGPHNAPGYAAIVLSCEVAVVFLLAPQCVSRISLLSQDYPVVDYIAWVLAGLSILIPATAAYLCWRAMCMVEPYMEHIKNERAKDRLLKSVKVIGVGTVLLGAFVVGRVVVTACVVWG